MNRSMIATLAAVAVISLGGSVAYAADADTAAMMGQQSYTYEGAQPPVADQGDSQYHAYVSQGSHGTWLFPPAQDSGAN